MIELKSFNLTPMLQATSHSVRKYCYIRYYLKMASWPEMAFCVLAIFNINLLFQPKDSFFLQVWKVFSK